MNPDIENERLFLKVEKLEKKIKELENIIVDLQRKYRLAPPPPCIDPRPNLFSKYNQPDKYYYSERN